ncbi:MAG: cobalamin-dependent protein [Lachnospiraceae bacterium]|nr:cobalamin-dependent protein [Lachnospiraceae bacterium]
MGAIIEEIIDSLKKGQGKRVTDLVKMALEEGISPQSILEDGFLAGMGQVADKFRKEEVGVPEILSVTRALERGVQSLRRYTGSSGGKEVGTVVLGTVKGDMHDIGKNLVKMMMESKNIRVVDLGVDVTPRRFLDEAIASKAQIVCMSGILSESEKDMKAVLDEFEERGIRDEMFFMVGGYFLDEEQAKKIGADCYTEDACACAERAYQYLVKKDKRKRY